ncbi:MAG: hypothetical protein O7G84_13880, partial [Gammaproteobacteria bacterium]|nr:hypothetical protein [Gammaproteobacteria bacterium]
VDQKTGTMIINEVTGLPKFALDMPSIDKFMGMYLKIHERVMLLRGEVTTRTEQLSDKNNPDTVDSRGLNEHLKQPAAIPPNFSKRDLRSMATQVLMGREPSLGGSLDEDIIDAPVEDEDGNDDQHDDTA